MKKILVTGATGFVGRHLVTRLVRDGHRLRCIVRDLRKASHLLEQNVEMVMGDLSNPYTAVQGAEGVDAIVHSAALLGGWERREEFIRNNVEATRNLLEAAVLHNVKRFVYVSSATSYGLQPNQLLTEESPTKFEPDPYCETKLLCEELVQSYSNSYGIQTTILRPSIIFGPFDFRFLPPIVRHVQEGTMIAIGKRNQGPPLVYINDVADFTAVVLCTQSASFEIYNLSSPEEVSWERIIKSVSIQLGVPSKVRRIPFELAYVIGAVLEFLWRAFGASKPPMVTRFIAGLIGLSYRFDSSKALTERGFLGFTPFSTAFETTIRWIQQEKSFDGALKCQKEGVALWAKH